jgi:hypothetical protein
LPVHPQRRLDLVPPQLHTVGAAQQLGRVRIQANLLDPIELNDFATKTADTKTKAQIESDLQQAKEMFNAMQKGASLNSQGEQPAGPRVVSGVQVPVVPNLGGGGAAPQRKEAAMDPLQAALYG